MFYISSYFVISLVVILLSAGFAGYNMTQIDKKDVWGAIFWPITLTTLLGQIIRVIKENKENNV